MFIAFRVTLALAWVTGAGYYFHTRRARGTREVLQISSNVVLSMVVQCSGTIFLTIQSRQTANYIVANKYIYLRVAAVHQ